jgi:hypothetical protein
MNLKVAASRPGPLTGVWTFLGALQPDNSVALIAVLIATFIWNRACLKIDGRYRFALGPA